MDEWMDAWMEWNGWMDGGMGLARLFKASSMYHSRSRSDSRLLGRERNDLGRGMCAKGMDLTLLVKETECCLGIKTAFCGEPTKQKETKGDFQSVKPTTHLPQLNSPFNQCSGKKSGSLGSAERNPQGA